MLNASSHQVCPLEILLLNLLEFNFLIAKTGLSKELLFLLLEQKVLILHSPF